MLDELSSFLDQTKRNTLVNQIELLDTSPALAAEAELSMLWAISKVAQLSAEPILPNSSHRPDAWSDDLFVSGPAVIEVRALSDDNFSGKEAMDRTANVICGYANQLRKKAGEHLHFAFSERSYFDKRFHRERCVDPNFTLTEHVKKLLKYWIMADDWPGSAPLRIIEGSTDVVVSWHKKIFRSSRVHSTMPPVAYDLQDNPIYKALKKKTKQVRGAPSGTLRCVFLVDVGCSLLRDLQTRSAVREVGGAAIINHSLRKHNIHIVCVFSHYREWPFNSSGSFIRWKVGCFDKRGSSVPPGEYERLNKLAALLPPPRFEGYQARSLHEQGRFGPLEGWHLGTTLHLKDGKMTIKVSARLIQEYLAGNIDPAEFQTRAFDKNRNLFEGQLSKGQTIRNVRFESGGLDKDDDYIVFEMGLDWAARPLSGAHQNEKKQS